LHERRLDPYGRRLAWTSLADISPALQAATVASEDRRFFHHGGVDGRALLGAIVPSTISMQVVTLITPDLHRRGTARTMRQKLRQMRLAWALERHWSKAEILEAYLNLVSYRGELQGIAAAARVLFDKAPHGITAAEAAVLAALWRGPNADSATVARRARALALTHGSAVMPQDITASIERAFRSPATTGSIASMAPHLAQRLLHSRPQADFIRSTLDSRLQAKVAHIMRRHLLAIRAQHVHDGAVLVVDNPTGEVLAYVAGSGDLSSARYVDGIQARRQTGSILKPFLYGLALERRILTAASLLEDTPLEIPTPGGLYRPRNYDEHFRGLVSLRTALAASLNIPAVRTLELVGTDAFVQQLRRLGLEGAIESGDYYGPSLALGSVDANLWELVQAYRTLATGGLSLPLRLTPTESEASPSQRLYSTATAFLLSHILADRDSRSLTFGLESPLSTRTWSAVKTGTSKEMRDNWCIGFTGAYTVGVWVGNLSGEPMHQVTGITGAAPIWAEIVAWLHRGAQSQPIAPPPGVLEQRVTFPSNVEPARNEWFLAGTEPPQAAPQAVGGWPRIETPVAGEVIALDPDIPPPHQRVVFAGVGTGAAHRWVLNGDDLGPALSPLLWEPAPGSHVLSLVGQAHQELDSVWFEVRPLLVTTDPLGSRK
jgi:penicillin-binding protein 1C